MANALIALLGLYALVGAQGYGQIYTGTTQTAPAKTKKVIAPAVMLIPAIPGRGIRDVPDIAIKYYDVSGKDFASIIQAIEKQRPRDPATKQLMAGGAGYELGASMTKLTSKGQCTVTAAKATFKPTAELPRLLNEQALKPDQLTMWRAYLSQIEAPAAAGLWYVHDRIPAFEKSMIGKECSVAAKIGSGGIAQMQIDHAEFQRKFVAAHTPPAPAPVPPKK